MKKKLTENIALRLIEHLLFGGLIVTFIAGIVILPNLLGKISMDSATHSTIWLNKSISFILIVGWMFMMAVLLLSNIVMKEMKDARITQQILGISLTLLQMELEKVKKREKKLLQQSDEDVNYKKEDSSVTIYGSTIGLIGKSGS